jgi:hypothetical protein
MGRMLVIGAALGVAVAALAGGRASADKLVPGGWLQPIEHPKAPPPPPPTVREATDAPQPVEHRRERVRLRRPAPHPAPAAAPSDGRVRF